MKGAFWRLVQKEIRQAAPMAAIVAGVVIAWHLFLSTRFGKWPSEGIIGLSALPLGFIPLWILWRSFATMRQEWTGNHMYLLLSLPVPGWYLASAKVIIVVVEAAFYTVVVGSGMLILTLSSGLLDGILAEAIVRPTWGPVLVMVAISVLSPLSWIVVTQFSYVAGRLTSKLSGLVSVIVFVLSGWFIVRMGTVLTPLLGWVPDLRLSADVLVDGVVVKNGWQLDVTPAIGAALAIAGLFWLGGYLLERDVEL